MRGECDGARVRACESNGALARIRMAAPFQPVATERPSRTASERDVLAWRRP